MEQRLRDPVLRNREDVEALSQAAPEFEEVHSSLVTLLQAADKIYSLLQTSCLPHGTLPMCQ